MNNCSIIAISGISGAGKSTIGRQLAQRLMAGFIDQDEFFDSFIPKVTLSNGHIRSNYDADIAVDIVRFNQRILKQKETDPKIVIVGFALRDYMFTNETRPTIHFHLSISDELSLQTRLRVKDFSEERKVDEILMFNDYVLPYYRATLEYSKIDHYIVICKDDQRRPIEEIMEEIILKC